MSPAFSVGCVIRVSWVDFVSDFDPDPDSDPDFEEAGYLLNGGTGTIRQVGSFARAPGSMRVPSGLTPISRRKGSRLPW
jgi:hypothetical protein